MSFLTIYRGYAADALVVSPDDAVVWFTDSRKQAERYARLRATDSGLAPWISQYALDTRFLDKFYTVTDPVAYGSLIFGNEVVVEASGRHSVIYRVHRRNFTQSFGEQTRLLRKHGFIGLIEPGVGRETVDYVFIENPMDYCQFIDGERL
jgi:hypothetical protein